MPANQSIQAEFANKSFGALTIATPSTVAVDFGTPNDIDLRALVKSGASEPGSRIVVVITAQRRSGTTSALTPSIQDAPDNAGNIGTPAAHIPSGDLATMVAGDAGPKQWIVSVTPISDRPWLRVNLTHASGTDTFDVTVTVFQLDKGSI